MTEFALPSRARRRYGSWLLVLALASLLLTFAEPRMTLERTHFRYLAVFDITQSMNVRDGGDRDGETLSRLEFSKRVLRDGIDLLPCGSELGVAIFTQHRTAVLIAPVEVCANYNELLALIGRISWRMAWDARSEVAKGLYSSVEVAVELGEHTSVAFFTDGHEAPPVNPRYKPRFAGTAGRVHGLVVGVGGDIPAPIPKFDASGEQRGYWRANEVLQIDTYSLGRSTGSDEQLAGVEISPGVSLRAANTCHTCTRPTWRKPRPASALAITACAAHAGWSTNSWIRASASPHRRRSTCARCAWHWRCCCW